MPWHSREPSHRAMALDARVGCTSRCKPRASRSISSGTGLRRATASSRPSVSLPSATDTLMRRRRLHEAEVEANTRRARCRQDPVRRTPAQRYVVSADFGWLWAGQSVSLVGTSVTYLALPLAAVLTLHASTLQMGVLAAAGQLPILSPQLAEARTCGGYGALYGAFRSKSRRVWVRGRRHHVAPALGRRRSRSRRACPCEGVEYRQRLLARGRRAVGERHAHVWRRDLPVRVENRLDHRWARLSEERQRQRQQRLSDAASFADVAGEAGVDHRRVMLRGHVRRGGDGPGAAHEDQRQEESVVATENAERRRRLRQ